MKKSIFSTSSLATMMLTIMVVSSSQPLKTLLKNPLLALGNETKTSEHFNSDEQETIDIDEEEELNY